MRLILLAIPLLFIYGCQASETDPREPLPKEASKDYALTLGYCYFKSSPVLIKPAVFVRGDVRIRGKQDGKNLKIEKVLYRLRGDVSGDESTLEISGPSWGKSLSRPLAKSIFWQEVPGLDLPRPAKRGETGSFTFDFDRPLINKSCSWRFRF